MDSCVKARDQALERFVRTGDEAPVMEYCLKYHVPVPTSREALAAGVYKAVLEIAYMPKEVKDMAREKCIALGFSPTIKR